MLCIAYIGYSAYDKKQKEEREMIELKKSVNRIIESEYNSLLAEYESIVETIKDYNYSYDLRFRYVMELNKLLDTRQYQNTGISSTTVENCIKNLDINEANDKYLLKQKAYKKARLMFRGTTE